MEWNYVYDPINKTQTLSGSPRGRYIISKYNKHLERHQYGGHKGPCDINPKTDQCRKGKKSNKKCELVKGNCRVIRRSPRLKKIRESKQIKVRITEIPEPKPKKSMSKKTMSKKSSPCCIPGYKGHVVFNDNVILAKEYVDKSGQFKVDPTGWWMSEKFDGYRALWNGHYFVSRSKRRFSVPSWFSAMMPPDIPLDGELWLGRSNFESCGLFRKKRPTRKDKIIEWSNEWKRAKVIFKVFDIPNIEAPFEERMKALKKLIKARKVCLTSIMKEEKMRGVSFPIQFTQQILVKSHKHVQTVFDRVVESGGEGIMLREPGSIYETKRSSTLLKYKEMADTECKIIGYKAGTGKYTGMLGAFKCELVSNPAIQFTISGMNDCVRKNYNKPSSVHSHPIGTIVTFKYNGFTKNGIPRHPQYMRKRHKV